MSTSVVLKCIGIAVTLIFILIWNFTVPDYNIYMPGTITKYAKTDTTWVGCYNSKLEVSLDIWLFHVIVLCNTKYTWVDIRSILRDWEEHIYDPNNLIQGCIISSLEKYNRIVDVAKRSDTEPVFKVATGYDYHFLPSTLRCNDYTNMEYLINILDMEIGGN